MNRREKFSHIARATFPDQERGVRILGVISIIALVGVSISGLWLLTMHAPDPTYVDYQPGGERLDQRPPTVASEIHDTFGTATGVIALLGMGWFAYRITHRLPMLGVVTLGVAVFGSLLGGAVEFDILKFDDQPLSAERSGYLQVFTGDLEYAVTRAGQVGPRLFQLLVASHVATVPVLVAYATVTVRRAIDRQHHELLNEPKRTWFTGRDR